MNYKHEASMWGRCESCGMTWDEQAKRREDKRQNVGKMVRDVAAGEKYTITRGDKPVAIVVPHEELQEWRAAVASMSEMERAATEYDIRRADGMSGDEEDARYAP